MTVTRRLRVYGKVQGVSYRNWTVAQARALGISGWVRNRADGTVEALVQGGAAVVDTFIARCHEGPPAALVHQVEVAEESGSEVYVAFERLPTL